MILSETEYLVLNNFFQRVLLYRHMFLTKQVLHWGWWHQYFQSKYYTRNQLHIFWRSQSLLNCQLSMQTTQELSGYAKYRWQTRLQCLDVSKRLNSICILLLLSFGTPSECTFQQPTGKELVPQDHNFTGKKSFKFFFGVTRYLKTCYSGCFSSSLSAKASSRWKWLWFPLHWCPLTSF